MTHGPIPPAAEPTAPGPIVEYPHRLSRRATVSLVAVFLLLALATLSTMVGLPYVIMRPNLFLQNIPESTIPAIDASGTFYVNAGQARISMKARYSPEKAAA